MPQNEQKYLKWAVPEYRKQQRGRGWYIAMAIFVIICLFFCFFTIRDWRLISLGLSSNFLFALIIIITAIIMVINEGRDPLMVNFELGPEGIRIGSKFYDYDSFKNFSVIYKPKQSVKNLYLEFKNSIHPRVSVPLRSLEALTVRNFLIKYLEEDLERTDPPLSEQLTKLLKL